MERYQRLALVAATVKELNEHGSRTSRSHLHKAIYFLQRWSTQEQVYGFIIYQYGPYAFELDKDISELLSFLALESHPAEDGFGAQYAVGKTGETLSSAFEEELKPWRPITEFVAKRLGPRPSRLLQLLATTAYVRDERAGIDAKDVIAEVRRLKPQYPKEEVEAAIEEIKALDEAARTLRQSAS